MIADQSYNRGAGDPGYTDEEYLSMDISNFSPKSPKDRDIADYGWRQLSHIYVTGKHEFDPEKILQRMREFNKLLQSPEE